MRRSVFHIRAFAACEHANQRHGFRVEVVAIDNSFALAHVGAVLEFAESPPEKSQILAQVGRRLAVKHQREVRPGGRVRPFAFAAASPFHARVHPHKNGASSGVGLIAALGTVYATVRPRTKLMWRHSHAPQPITQVQSETHGWTSLERSRSSLGSLPIPIASAGQAWIRTDLAGNHQSPARMVRAEPAVPEGLQEISRPLSRPVTRLRWV